MLRLVVLRLLSCLCFVLSCLALASVLVLSCLLRVVFLLRCAASLSSWVDLSTHFCSFGVVLGVDVGHLGSSWGALGVVVEPGKHLHSPAVLATLTPLLVQEEFTAATGACLMVRSSDFDRIQGFDEDLAVVFNDVDLCLA